MTMPANHAPIFLFLFFLQLEMYFPVSRKSLENFTFREIECCPGSFAFRGNEFTKTFPRRIAAVHDKMVAIVTM